MHTGKNGDGVATIIELQPRRVRQLARRLMELEVYLTDAPRPLRSTLADRRVALLAELEREAQLRPSGDALRWAIVDVLDAYDRLIGHVEPVEMESAIAAYEIALEDLARMPFGGAARTPAMRAPE